MTPQCHSGPRDHSLTLKTKVLSQGDPCLNFAPIASFAIAIFPLPRKPPGFAAMNARIAPIVWTMCCTTFARHAEADFLPDPFARRVLTVVRKTLDWPIVRQAPSDTTANGVPTRSMASPHAFGKYRHREDRFEAKPGSCSPCDVWTSSKGGPIRCLRRYRVARTADALLGSRNVPRSLRKCPLSTD